MNKVEFMKELRAGIVKLPYQEAEAALDYYEEYFSEAGPENETKVIEELGDPKQIARQIMEDFNIKEVGESLNELIEQKESLFTENVRSPWQIVLMVLAIPIALPFALAVVLLILAIELVIIAFGFVGTALGVSGVISLIVAATRLPNEWATGIFAIGMGFICLGLAQIVGRSSYYCFKYMNSTILVRIKEVVSREKNRRRI